MNSCPSDMDLKPFGTINIIIIMADNINNTIQRRYTPSRYIIGKISLFFIINIKIQVFNIKILLRFMNCKGIAQVGLTNDLCTYNIRQIEWLRKMVFRRYFYILCLKITYPQVLYYNTLILYLELFLEILIYRLTTFGIIGKYF